LFPPNSFDAVMAFSVLEHLLMPWKFVIELNRVLKKGAVGLFTTHQCWPLHDQPWDFWRFSDKAWDGLLNSATGFLIVEAEMGEPAFVVAQRCHPVTNFGDAQGGFLSSSVIFKKISDTSLEWPVKLAEVTTTTYPGAT
jgi:Methyltransferase domain